MREPSARKEKNKRGKKDQRNYLDEKKSGGGASERWRERESGRGENKQ